MKNHYSGLKTDLYELTMAAGYYKNNVKLKATFELFCYKSYINRSYFVFCGLQQAVDYLLNLRFSKEDIDYLRNLPLLKSIDKCVEGQITRGNGLSNSRIFLLAFLFSLIILSCK